MKTFLLLCSLIAFSSLGELLSAKGMQEVGDVSLRPRALLGALGRMLRNRRLFGGVACLAVSFFSFLSLLSYADLSFVVPLTAVSYLTNTLGARFFLGERISRERWLGTLLVTCGVALVSLSSGIGPERGGEWLLTAMRALLSLLVVCAIAYYLIGFVAGFLWFADRRRQRALGLNYRPPVTIFKPVCGVDAEAYENFASFCRQDYPAYQMLFGVRDADDAVVPIIERLRADFPDRNIELIVSARETGLNAKVSNLQNMYPHARHDVLLIADSDIRVERDYLRRVVAPLQRERVGMVTCLYRGAAARTFAALLEDIGISSTFGPEVCSSRALEGIAFALGSTIVTRRALLERSGGFAAVADYLADDFLLGQHTARLGYEVVLSDCVVEHVGGATSMAAMLKHQLRWGRSTRISRPWGYRGLLLTYGTATALLTLAASGFSVFAWRLFAATMIARFLPVWLIGVGGLRDRTLARYFWLVPLRDLLTFGVWLVSFFGDEVEWRGTRFRVLRDGKLARTKTKI